MQEGPSSSKKMRGSHLVHLTQTQSSGAFLQDSNIIKEARSCFFSNHSHDWVHDGTDDLSSIFKELAESAGLLGIHLWNTTSWTRPEELKQANYALQSLPKGLRFLRAVPALESPKVMGLMGIHNPNALWCYAGYTYWSLVWEGGAKWGTMVNHLEDNPLQARPCVWPVLWLPNSDVGLTLLAWVPKLPMVQCPFGLGLSNWPTCLTKSLYKGVKVVLFYQTPFPLEGQEIWQRGHYSPAHWPILYSPVLLTRQLFLFQLWLTILNTLTQTDCSQGGVHQTTTPNS